MELKPSAVPGAIQQEASKEVQVAEYESLRSEINSNSQVGAQSATVGITAVIAFMTFGLDKQSWVIFIAPAILAIVSVIFITSQYSSTARIAAYIRRRHEERDLRDLQWESALNIVRSQLKRDVPTINFLFSLAVTFALLIAMCCVLSIYYFWTNVGSPFTNLFSAPLTPDFDFAIILIVTWGVLLTLATITISQLSQCFSAQRFEYHYNNWSQALALLEEQHKNELS